MDKGIIVLALVGMFSYLVKEIPRRILDIIVKRASISVSVSSDNRFVFKSTESWIMSLDKKILKNNINIRNEWTNADMDVCLMTNYGDYIFALDKLTFVIVQKSCLEKGWDLKDKLDIRIIGKNRYKYKENLLKYIEDSNDTSMLSVYTDSNDCAYKTVPKTFNDVFIEDKESIIKHLDRWISNKSFYREHGITYKTGIMLYGEPGTGKTSTARAIAGYMGYSIHVINLKSYRDVASLIRRVIYVPAKSVVLFEDIDCITLDRSAKKENYDEPVVTVSDGPDPMDDQRSVLGVLLNILDGVLSPSEVIFLATTNHIEKLDKALLRHGRFDLHLHVTDINEALAKEMCDRYGVSRDILKGEEFPINPAYLQTKIIQYKNTDNLIFLADREIN